MRDCTGPDGNVYNHLVKFQHSLGDLVIMCNDSGEGYYLDGMVKRLDEPIQNVPMMVLKTKYLVEYHPHGQWETITGRWDTYKDAEHFCKLCNTKEINARVLKVIWEEEEPSF